MHVIHGTLCHSAEVILMLLTLLNLLLKLIGGRVSTNPLHWLPLGANTERTHAPIRCDCVTRRLLLLELGGDLVVMAATTLIKMLLLLSTIVNSLRGDSATIVGYLLALGVLHGCCCNIEPIMHAC